VQGLDKARVEWRTELKTMTNCDLIHTLPVKNTLGESVLWNELTQAIWWTDIEGKKLLSYGFSSEVLETYDLPERLGSFAMIAGSAALLAAFETGLGIYDPVVRSIDWLEKIYEKGCGIRLNDGKVDRHGRFWVGAMIENTKAPRSLSSQSSLFRYSGTKNLSVLVTDIQISNSLCWSPDGSVMYFADSPKNTIYAYDIVGDTGDIENKRIFTTTEMGVHPDGSCVDSEGYVWNAQWGAGQVVRYTPEGDIDFILKVPSLQPTCVSFGGPDLTHLFVTSAQLDMTAEDKKKYPLSGALFIYETPYKGLKEPRFKIGG